MPQYENEALMKHVKRRQKELESLREPMQPWWEDITAFILPWNGLFDGTKPSDAQRSVAEIYHPAPTYAVNVMAAGLQGGLTSPARPWFQLATKHPAGGRSKAAKAWLKVIEDLMYSIFSQSNVYQGLHHVYKELPYGTAAVVTEKDYESVIRLRPLTIGEYVLGVGHDLKVDSFGRKFWLPAHAALKWFGEKNCSERLRELAKNHEDTPVMIDHFVEPNEMMREDKPFNAGKEFRSVYFEDSGHENKNFLRESGYGIFPVLAPRWSVVPGAPWGWGPGETALGIVQIYQQFQKKTIKAFDMSIDPPLVAPPSLETIGVNQLPGGVNYVQDPSGDKFGPLFSIDFHPERIKTWTDDLQYWIGKSFFNDLFLMFAQEPMRGRDVTAREVVERHEEKMLMIGPVLEQLYSDLLDPLIDTAFSYIMDAGIAPPPPAELEGEELKVEYISVLAQAQRMAGMEKVEQFSGFVGSIAEFQAKAGKDPDVIDNIDFDKAVHIYGDMMGVHPEILRDEKKRDFIRAEKARAMQQQMMMAQAQQAAQVGKDMSAIENKENNAIGALMGQRGSA